MAFWKKKATDVAVPTEAAKAKETNTVEDDERGFTLGSGKLNSSGKKRWEESERKRARTSPDRVIEKEFGQVRSALSSGTLVQGKLTFDGPVRIDGQLSGEISSSSLLIVGPNGKIDASVQAAQLVIFGHVKGEVIVKKKVRIHSSGILEGEIRCPSLTVEEGGVLNAECIVAKETGQRSLTLTEAVPLEKIAS